MIEGVYVVNILSADILFSGIVSKSDILTLGNEVVNTFHADPL